LRQIEGSFKVGLSDRPGAVHRANRDFFIAVEEDITAFAIYLWKFSAVYGTPCLTVDTLGRRGDSLVETFRGLFLKFKEDPLTTGNLTAMLRLSRPARERHIKERLDVFFGGFKRGDYPILTDWYVKQLSRLNVLMSGVPGFSTITVDDCCDMVFLPGTRILSTRLVSSLAELSAEADAVDKLLREVKQVDQAPGLPAGSGPQEDTVIRLADEIEGSKAYFRDRCAACFRDAADTTANPSPEAAVKERASVESSLATGAIAATATATAIVANRMTPATGPVTAQPSETPPQSLPKSEGNPLMLSAQSEDAEDLPTRNDTYQYTIEPITGTPCRSKTLREGEPFETEYARFLFLTSGRANRSPRARSPWGSDTMWRLPQSYVQQRECNLIRRCASAEPRHAILYPPIGEVGEAGVPGGSASSRLSGSRHGHARPSSARAGYALHMPESLLAHSLPTTSTRLPGGLAPLARSAGSNTTSGNIQDAVVRDVIKFADNKREYYLNFLDKVVEFLNTEAELCDAAGVGSGLSERLGRGVFLAGLGSMGDTSSASGSAARGNAVPECAQGQVSGGASQAAAIATAPTSTSQAPDRRPHFTVVSLAEALAANDYQAISLVSQPLAEIARLRCDLASSITTITNLQLLLQRVEAENVELKSRASQAHIEGKQSELVAAAKEREAAALRQEADGLRGTLEGLQARHAVERLRGPEATAEVMVDRSAPDEPPGPV